ncbi:hypothetical protein ROA7450_02860 [Roseovarius albus]|uniref:DUF1826 domain-containing protein n=1 Tax=Roseovarius albus TaxID=1247867 RepID=A0A1X6ZLR5_9RHOB|nr:DUF1826 domain-containing protein [Roseovarius albus]SLN55384.1 hypothetical protein ROA7450_02860 [Roseovarius albus]
MNFVPQNIATANLNIALADDPGGLSAFNKADCPAAIWQRQANPEFQSWIDQVETDRLPRGRVILRPGAVSQAMEHLCEMANTPKGSALEWLKTDISELASLFADLMQAPFMRLRLDVVTTNACRKFHIDAITARLVCTYRGTGTQYGTATGGSDPKQIHTVPSCAPILLRGSLNPTIPPSGLVHRSPPIEGTGESRLVLVLDPVFDPDQEAEHRFHH